MSLAFSGGWSWALFAFIVGYYRRSKVESALLASSALAVGVVVYYLFKFLNPAAPLGRVISDGSGDELSSRILLWGIAAFVCGGPVGFLGNLARTPGIGGLWFRLLVPLIAFFETSQRLGTEADSQSPVVEITWNAIRVVAGVVAVALVGHTVWSWWCARRSRSNGSAEVSAPTKRL
ncbi:hypothetical protein ACFWFF_37535 [Streptomyces sp. NPDC060223]|uniref:hypothetical protein n=1 Tax=unclassified Streptomyces TaxID=2593676 RepID=UPI00363552DB